MNLDDYTVERVPSYAVCYLVNADSTGLEDEDIEAIDGWVDMMLEEGYDMTVFDFMEEEPHFTSRPAFGLACDCYETKIYKRN